MEIVDQIHKHKAKERKQETQGHYIPCSAKSANPFQNLLSRASSRPAALSRRSRAVASLLLLLFKYYKWYHCTKCDRSTVGDGARVLARASGGRV